MTHSHSNFMEAFRGWDGDALARAATSMVESAIGERLSPGDVDELTWNVRSYLESVLGHPNLGGSFQVGRYDFIFDVMAKWHEGRPAALAVSFAPSAKEEVLREHWRTLGFPLDAVAVPRGELNVPVPLKGEPGYGTVKLRSIHEPSRIDLPADSSWAVGRSLARGTGPWLRRYLAGEYEGVWREMLSLGGAIRAPDMFGDAVDVALETMRRVRSAVEALHRLLLEGGYEFERPEEAFVRPSGNENEAIGALEAKVGLLPLSLCAFLTEVGSINFCGTHPRWTSRGDAILDPLYVGPADWLLEYDEDNWYRHRYQFEIAPDRYHKEDISGGPPYTLQAPDAAADGVVVYHASEPQFVELLRQSLAFGGFPGWASDVGTDRPSEELGRLTRGLPRV